jgi:hypothetical protein
MDGSTSNGSNGSDGCDGSNGSNGLKPSLVTFGRVDAAGSGGQDPRTLRDESIKENQYQKVHEIPHNTQGGKYSVKKARIN